MLMKCFIDKINNIFPFVLTKQMKSHFVEQFVYLLRLCLYCLYIDPLAPCPAVCAGCPPDVRVLRMRVCAYN